MNEDRLFTRIEELFDVGAMGQARVLVAGCGSGGSQTALQLAMSGVRNFSFFDRDTLEIENVIRHACGRRYVGQLKVQALKDLLLDRNPSAQIETHAVDLMQYSHLEDEVRRA